MKRLIKETSKEERKEYIQSLFQCKNGDCDNCGVCKIFKGNRPEEIFKEYIEGNSEFQEVYSKWNMKNR